MKKEVPQEDPIQKISENKTEETEAPYMAAGKEVYDQYCLVCHQVSGDGVPGLNPPLIGSKYIEGEKEQLLNIILYGSARGLEANSTTYTNNMPGFEHLSDQQIADVASYIRNSFENMASSVTKEEVKEQRLAK